MPEVAWADAVADVVVAALGAELVVGEGVAEVEDCTEASPGCVGVELSEAHPASDRDSDRDSDTVIPIDVLRSPLAARMSYTPVRLQHDNPLPEGAPRSIFTARRSSERDTL